MDLGSTTWKNPTAKPVRLKLFVAPGQHQTYEVPPGGTQSIPNQFTHAIHHIHNGVIIGGAAPQLVREGQEETVHLTLTAPPAKPADTDKPAENPDRR